MLPRKRQRPNPASASSPSAAPSATPTPQQQASTSQPDPTSDPASHDQQQHMPPPAQPNGKPSGQGGILPMKSIRKAQSWYGSWPRTPKASASTSVARENIFGGSVRSEKAPDLSRFDPKKDSETSSIRSTTKSASGLARIQEGGQNSSKMGTDGNESENVKGADQKGEGETETSGENTQSQAPSVNVTDTSTTQEPNNVTPQRPATSSGWLGWWSRTPFTDTQPTSSPQPMDTEDTTAKDTQVPSTPPAQTAQSETAAAETTQEPPRSTPWFGFWSSAAPKNKPEDSDGKGNEEQADSAAKGKAGSSDVAMPDAPAEPNSKPEPTPKAGSTWGFWSKDSPKSRRKTLEEESGEIAVIGEGSEAHPKPMPEGDVTPSKDPKAKQDSIVGGKSTWRRNKRLRPPSMDIDAQSPSGSGTSTPAEPQQQSNQAKVDSSNRSIAESEASSKTQQNLLLPSFESTYQMKQDPSILKQVAQFLMRTQQAPINHVLRVKDTPKIRKAISIGIHGLFPALYLRPMIGQPTGTSLRFASLGADAIRRWADSHGSPDCEIEKVALEGEGKISERVDNLWKLMLNWIEHIRKADLILISCHSQGVPVSIMLLEKLIDLGIITNAKIGVCAMAGVSLGPFPDYKSGILMGSAIELWDFGNPESANALRFETSLKRVLDYGARITFIGSIDDQLVPMESAVYSPANHPHIYRAVFIDGRVHAPDFIAHLVGFALKLRNLGVSDHGLIRELSVPLAGSLYSGEGHSRLYYDDQVYDLALSHTLETTSAPAKQACDIHHRHTGTIIGAQQQQSNPYVLPWIMRGLLEEDFVKTQLNHETEELLKQFDEWKPSNKALKDVKYRLEAVRSKL